MLTGNVACTGLIINAYKVTLGNPRRKTAFLRHSCIRDNIKVHLQNMLWAT
jgi:hypothetical protein